MMKWAKICAVVNISLSEHLRKIFSVEDFNAPLKDNEYYNPDIDIASNNTKTFPNIDNLIDDLEK